MKKRGIKNYICMCIFLLILFIIFNYNFADEINYCDEFNKINNLRGSLRWVKLKEYILKLKRFGMPPNIEFDMLDNNLLELYDYRVREIKKIKGFWDINPKKGQIKIKFPNHYMETFRSFKIECEKESNIFYIMIIFSKDTIFKEPNVDIGENYASTKYLILYHNLELKKN